MTPEEAYEQYHEAVFDFAYRMTRSADVAEDLTQDCFLAFMNAPERFDSTRATLRTYLFAIARNLVLKHRRDNGRDSQLHDPCPVVDPSPSCEISMIVEKAAAALPPFQREALVLFEYEGLTLEEIAAAAQVDIGTVKSRLHHARENLNVGSAGRKGGSRME